MSDDLRNRFRGSGRRDYVGAMPPARPPQPQPRPQPPSQRPPEPRRPEPTPQYQPSAFPSAPSRAQQRPPKVKKRRKSHKKFWVFLIILLLLAGGVAAGYWKVYLPKYKSKPNKTNDSAQTQETKTPPVTTATKSSIKLIATGDMIPHAAILERAKKADGTYDFSPMFENMKKYFEIADVDFCNQATPAGGTAFGYTGYPIFNAPLEWPKAIAGVGCDVINLGTNHTNDKGQPLIDATVKAWDAYPNVLTVGANRNAAEQAKPRTFEKDGVKFAVLSYSTYTNSKLTNTYGINMYDKAGADSDIAEARKDADIILVSMRWGTEYSAGVNADQDRIAQELADAGADIVLGHGPHFLEPVKKLKGLNGKTTWVWFSLGNFLNAQIETESLIGGFAIMDIDTSTKKIADPKFMPVYVHYEWTAEQKKANDLLGRKNFAMYPLDQASVPMSKSLIGTTVEAQTDRVTKLLNTFTPVSIIKASQF